MIKLNSTTRELLKSKSRIDILLYAYTNKINYISLFAKKLKKSANVCIDVHSLIDIGLLEFINPEENGRGKKNYLRITEKGKQVVSTLLQLDWILK